MQTFFTERGSHRNTINILRTLSKNVQNLKNINLQILSANTLLKSQKGLAFQNLNTILIIFGFSHVLHWETCRAILSVNQNRSTNGTIPTKVLRSLAKEIRIPLTDCINSAILNEIFHLN